MLLEGKKALVTGTSRGIGRGIALALARAGADVVVNYNSSEDAAREVGAEITRLGRRAQIVRADVGKLADITNLFENLDDHFSNLDILVNNAGSAKFTVTDEVTEKEFDEQFNLNVKGLYFLTQHAIKRMNGGGRIVNISSGITRANAAFGSVYAGTKGAVENFTRSWAAELGERGITVNTVSPGMVETDLLTSSFDSDRLEEAAKSTLLGRIGQPDDIADVVVFLCSDKGRWLTAENLLANGGMS